MADNFGWRPNIDYDAANSAMLPMANELRSFSVSRLPAIAVGLALFGGSAWASAAPNEATDDDDATSDSKPRWIKRFAPERNMWELGVFGGAWFPSTNHEFFEANEELVEQGYQDLDRAGGAVGARLAYLPIRHFGLEIEGALFPTQTAGGQETLFWSARGHLLAQVGLRSITPFVVGGIGAMGVSSDRNALGDDQDFAVHFGGGLKFFINRVVMLRLDLRDIVAAKRGVDNGITNNGEVTLGLSLTLGRKKPEPPPSDRDGDGFIDRDDACPDEPGVAPDGCPIPDSDGDGFLDPDDACPDEPGVAPDGCPIPDSDNDGYLDPDDACPQEPGVAPDGCPLRDKDGDGIFDNEDQCVDEPETKNGFEDADGCPDELPEQVQQFTGVIEGIYFDVNRDTIKPRSQPKLMAAVEVLTTYPSIRLEITGHTDNRGKHDYNVDLSQRRAASVRQYLVDQGIDESRVEIRGAGPDEPIDTNRTSAGRAKNRRIEFKVLQ